MLSHTRKSTNRLSGNFLSVVEAPPALLQPGPLSDRRKGRRVEALWYPSVLPSQEGRILDGSFRVTLQGMQERSNVSGRSCKTLRTTKAMARWIAGTYRIAEVVVEATLDASLEVAF